MTDRAITPLVEQPDTRQPGSGFGLIPWRRPSILAPLVDAVVAARDYFSPGTDDVPTSTEPMDMPVAKTPEEPMPPPVEATPSSARMEAAVRKAAGAKAKAREAKAALKQSKKAFRLARKAAKAARKEVEALQAAIARAEERAATAAKRVRATRRAPKSETSPPRAAAKPARRTRRASTTPGQEVVYTEPLATPADTAEGSRSTTSS